MTDLYLIYSIIILIGIFFFSFYTIELMHKKRLIKEIHYKWNSLFDIRIWLNWLKLGFLVAYSFWAIYLILSEPKRANDFTPLVLLALFFCFYPTWFVFIGSRGMIIRRKLILWETVKDWKIIKKGWLKYLEIRYESAPNKEKIKKLPIPDERKIENILRNIK